MAEETSAGDKLNNRVALTIAVLASFIALAAIKGGNVAQAMEIASAERTNSWAWYQAVRTREDMSTYELAHLNRLARTARGAESERLAAEITAQEEEIARIRTRLQEVQDRARAAEAEHSALSVIDDEYDLSTALISIAMAILAVCVLAKTFWLFWFALVPGGVGIAVGLMAMLRLPIDAQFLFGWLS
jgi:hypothetical protein